MQGEAVYENMEDGFIIDAANPKFYLNGEETPLDKLEEVFDSNFSNVMDALYSRAFDLPSTEMISQYRKVH